MGFREMTFRILVVEDDQLIRETVADILTSEGFDVLEAESGEQRCTFVKCTPPISFSPTYAWPAR
jgi:DNA-binding response OmpR family regulator